MQKVFQKVLLLEEQDGKNRQYPSGPTGVWIPLLGKVMIQKHLRNQTKQKSKLGKAQPRPQPYASKKFPQH